MKKAIFMLVSAIAIGAAPAWADDYNWIHWDRSMFPSRVQSITFKAGGVLDAGNGLCWGKWCVDIDPAKPVVANYGLEGGGRNGATIFQIKIDNLACKNDVAGLVPCRMWLWNGGGGCGISRQNSAEVQATDFLFQIDCPTNLKLQ